MYDTFHEPFKRSVPNHAPVPASAGESERNKYVEEIQDASKRQKKEEDVIVKSALKAAFAKYSGRKGKNVVQEEKSTQVNNDEEDFAT